MEHPFLSRVAQFQFCQRVLGVLLACVATGHSACISRFSTSINNLVLTVLVAGGVTQLFNGKWSLEMLSFNSAGGCWRGSACVVAPTDWRESACVAAPAAGCRPERSRPQRLQVGPVNSWDHGGQPVWLLLLILGWGSACVAAPTGFGGQPVWLPLLVVCLSDRDHNGDSKFGVQTFQDACKKITAGQSRDLEQKLCTGKL
jgi:hypothetical protein